MLVLSVFSSRFPYMSILISGGYSDGAPPLPIPNREVKPVRADGTASSGRVGSRRFFPEESGIPHNVECRISGLYDPHEGWPCRSESISEVPLKDALNAFIWAHPINIGD